MAIQASRNMAYLTDIFRRLTRGMAAQILGDHTDQQLIHMALGGRDEAAFQAMCTDTVRWYFASVGACCSIPKTLRMPFRLPSLCWPRNCVHCANMLRWPVGCTEWPTVSPSKPRLNRPAGGLTNTKRHGLKRCRGMKWPGESSLGPRFRARPAPRQMASAVDPVLSGRPDTRRIGQPTGLGQKYAQTALRRSENGPGGSPQQAGPGCSGSTVSGFTVGLQCVGFADARVCRFNCGGRVESCFRTDPSRLWRICPGSCVSKRSICNGVEENSAGPAVRIRDRHNCNWAQFLDRNRSRATAYSRRGGESDSA